MELLYFLSVELIYILSLFLVLVNFAARRITAGLYMPNPLFSGKIVINRNGGIIDGYK